MTGWEYKVVEKWGAPLTTEEFNKFGDESWDLSTVIPAYETMQGTMASPLRYYVFKRPKII
jgi:hypothetical protein